MWLGQKDVLISTTRLFILALPLAGCIMASGNVKVVQTYLVSNWMSESYQFTCGRWVQHCTMTLYHDAIMSYTLVVSQAAFIALWAKKVIFVSIIPKSSSCHHSQPLFVTTYINRPITKTDTVSDQHLELGKTGMEASFSNVHSLPTALLKITSVTWPLGMQVLLWVSSIFDIGTLASFPD